MKLFAWLLLPSALVSAETFFHRIATYNVCKQTDPACNFDDETVAEIVAATPDGMMLVYTDGAMNSIGMVDITDPNEPTGAGMIDVGGEPTSVAVSKDGQYALVAVNTSPDYVNASGTLLVIDLETRETVSTFDLGGQPDSIAVSPDNQYAVIAIENERDEDLEELDGRPPQMPAGFLYILNKAASDPNEWTGAPLDLTNTAGALFGEDPEPEYVDISEYNIAIVTLQENNALVMVDLMTLEMKGLSAGTVDLDQIDTEEEGVISQNMSLKGVPREPDAVTWMGPLHFATADEGDLDGGSRGFTIYSVLTAKVVYSSGNTMDHEVARIGHYPEERSGNKGNEPEGITYDVFGEDKLLFVLSERSSVVFVYNVANLKAPVLKQILPAGSGPEGVAAIPDRGLIAVASEVDGRGDKIRSSIAIYAYDSSLNSYPSVVSTNRADGTPIPFSALSGLACGEDGTTLYTVEDSFYGQSRFFSIDTSSFPYTLNSETRITDPDGLIAAVAPDRLVDGTDFVNLDLEGITVSQSGGFWVASEGRGTVGDEGRPFEYVNMVVKVSDSGVTEKVVTLPEELNAVQLRFGFEGVAEYDEKLFVAFQRAWNNEPNPRIGIYDIVEETWKFLFYPLDARESQNGGWVGLSDIAPIGDGTFFVLERDNQGGVDAAIKRVYHISPLGVEEGETLEKTLVMDLIPTMNTLKGNLYEKVEGLCVTGHTLWFNNDNDGVDDNSGETFLFRVAVDIPEVETTPASVANSSVAMAVVETDEPTLAPKKGEMTDANVSGAGSGWTSYYWTASLLVVAFYFN